MLVVLLSMVSCGRKAPVQSTCVMTVASPGEEFSRAVLYDADNQALDSVCPGEGATIVRNDTTAMPYLGFLRFYNPAEPADVIEIPVAVEGGEVTVDLNRRLGAVGTPLNDKLYEFLAERNRLNKLYTPSNNPGLTLEEMESAYSIFYVEQINKADKLIGDFLEKSYGVHIQPGDRAKLRARE